MHHALCAVVTPIIEAGFIANTFANYWLGLAFAIGLRDWTLGPLGVGLGCAIIIGVVRRWLWVEEDRVQFIVRRGADMDGVQRIGFGQDLRDEALTVMIALFVFIPLGLRQADLQLHWFHEQGSPNLGAWIGFFGAELAKAVPLVDWSEVFGVANGSPIQPREGVPGAAVAVFVLRMTLDLLLIASVLQAFQIATQLHEQARAFDERMAQAFKPDAAPEAVMTLACALAALETGARAQAADAAAGRFVEPLRVMARAADLNGLPEAPGAFARFEAGASFLMGSPKGEGGDAEHPQHPVTFARPFAIARFAVTFDEYDLFCNDAGRRAPFDVGWGRGRRPVIEVTWEDAQEYIAWLNGRLGLASASRGRESGGRDAGGLGPYRLPSEAEWEYACRAGTQTRYSFSDDASDLGDYAWFNGNAGGRTHPIGEKSPTHSACSTCTAMSGNGAKTCGTPTTPRRTGRTTDQPGGAAMPRVGCSAAALGTAAHGTSAPRSATGASRRTGTALSVSVWPGPFCLVNLYLFTSCVLKSCPFTGSRGEAPGRVWGEAPARSPTTLAIGIEQLADAFFDGVRSTLR